MVNLAAALTIDQAPEPGRLRALQTGLLWATLATLVLVPAVFALFFVANSLSIRVIAIARATLS
jgi:hypothetical protein